MRLKTFVGLSAVGVAICSVATVLPAQEKPVPSASEIGELLRERGDYGTPLQLLTQMRGQMPRARLDEIADTLTAIAITYSGSNDPQAIRASGAAKDALLLAGTGEQGVAYPGSAERLLRIALESGSGGALWALTRLPNRPQVLQELWNVAISDRPLAYLAVGLLAREMGPEGLSTLRVLHGRGLVVEPRAKGELAGIANYHRW